MTPPNRQRLLITGASGKLGLYLVREALGKHDVLAVTYRHPLTAPGLTAETVDLTDPGEVQRIMDLASPDWVVNCAADTDIDACERAPGEAVRVNVDLARELARHTHRVGARLLHVSTDAVFDGTGANYRETDEPEPVNAYGRTKLAAERSVMEAHPSALVVRTNFYGWSSPPRQSLAEWFIHRLEHQQETPGFVDAWFSPIYAGELARTLLEMTRRRLAGVFHVAGRQCVTKHGFGVQVAKVFGLDPRLVRPMSVADAGLLAPRGKRLCLDSSKVEAALGTQLSNLESGLQEMKAAMESGDRAWMQSVGELRHRESESSAS